MTAKRSEWQRMLAGEEYDAADPALSAARRLCRQLYQTLNSGYGEADALLSELLGRRGQQCSIHPPFFCDYGCHIHVGENFYANVGCTLIDVCEIRIGDNVLLGPNVQIYTAGHPIAVAPRIAGQEFGKPVRIGNNVWIGGSAILCPGVTIGDHSVIGAGSVVTRDIPAGVVAAGNPCRVLRTMTAAELADVTGSSSTTCAQD